MKYIEQRDQILQNLRDLFTQLSEETDEARRSQLKDECHKQLNLLDQLDGRKNNDQ